MILFLLFLFLISILLVYLSVIDIKSHEVSLQISIAGVALALIFVIINSILEVKSAQIPDFKSALLGFAVGAGISFLIVLISKERALGAGDILLFGIMGLSLGVTNMIAGFLIAVYTATFYGIFLAIRKRKFHGLQVPLVPFISLGIVFGLILQPQITAFIQQFIVLF